MKRTAAGALTPLVRFVEWLFGPRAPGLDVGLFLFASGWASMMIAKPELFDSGRFSGMAWMPDFVWITFFVLLTLMHGAGCICPAWRAIRVAGMLMSSWVWLSISASFFRIEMTTGVLAYAIVGFGALCGGIFVAGLPRHDPPATPRVDG